MTKSTPPAAISQILGRAPLRWQFLVCAALAGLWVHEASGQAQPPKRAKPAAAQRDKSTQRENKPRPPKVPLGEFFALPKKVTLSAEQATRLEELKQAYLPQLTECYQAIETLYTPQRRESEAKAIRLAREAGKNRDQVNQAAQSALYLNDEEFETLNSARTELAELRLQIRKDIYALLTPEQQALVPNEVRPTRTTAEGPLTNFLGQLLRGIQLSDEQQQKIEEIEGTFNPIYQAEVNDVVGRIITPERRAAQRDALKAAKAAGKSAKEIEAIQATVPGLDDQDRAALDGAREAQVRLQTAIRERLSEVLTPEQQAALNAGKKRK